MALALQSKLVVQKLNNRANEPDYLIMLEHEPCVTLGRRYHSHILNTQIPIIKVKPLHFYNYLSELFSHHVVGWSHIMAQASLLVIL